MYKYFLFYLIFNFIFCIEITGYQLAQMIDDKEQPQSSKSEISMTLINLKKDRKKTKEMFSITTDDGNKMLLFFKTPKRDKGVGFLKVETEDSDKLSLFIPKLKKIRRISSSNQSDSFMGSDLSFEDLSTRVFDDYDYSFIKDSHACKIALPQDDYDCSEILDEWMTNWRIDRIYTICMDHWEEVYPKSIGKIDIQKGYTGYISDQWLKD